VFGGEIAGLISISLGLRNLVSSSRPCPSGDKQWGLSRSSASTSMGPRRRSGPGTAPSTRAARPAGSESIRPSPLRFAQARGALKARCDASADRWLLEVLDVGFADPDAKTEDGKPATCSRTC
jgi:hypothetical protein